MLFRDGLAMPPGLRRQLQIRDAAMIGIFAELAPRARAMQSLTLRHLLRGSDGWTLRQEGPMMKDQHTILELPLSPRIGAILDQYIAVERLELLQGQDHDALWVTGQGRPLSRAGLEHVVRTRSKTHYGIAFGPHRFRTSLTTTVALVAGNQPFDASIILGHHASTSLSNYNRARGIEASRAQDQRITDLEDGDSPPRPRRVGQVSQRPATAQPRPAAKKRTAKRKPRLRKAG
jgi:integrase